MTKHLNIPRSNEPMNGPTGLNNRGSTRYTEYAIH